MVNIVNKTKFKDFKEYYPLLDEYYNKVLKVLNKDNIYNLSIIIVGPRSIRRINKQYRNIDAETDVISFALLDDGIQEIYEDNIELGDIFINYQRVLKQAAEYKHSIKREFIFLYVHGLLHLFGYDHMLSEDEKVMFSLQKKIIGKLQ